MEPLHSFLHYDPNLVQFTNVNSGLASHARQIPGTADILVSGIREGTYYFEFDSIAENGTPRFKKGRLLDLGQWAGDVDLLPHANGWQMLIHGGETVRTTDAEYKNFGPETSLGLSQILDTNRYGRSASTVCLFQRHADAPQEMIVGISDMSQYYPGEKDTYGGRAIGIDQDGKNIALDENGNWLGGSPLGEYYLFTLESNANGVTAHFSGRITVNGQPFATTDGNGGIAIADFNNDGQLEAILLSDWELEVYQLNPEPGDCEMTFLQPAYLDQPGTNYRSYFQYPWPSAYCIPGETNDGLLMGCYSGQIYHSRNIDPEKFVFSAPELVQCRDTLIRVGSFLVPAAADWNGDGLPDLVLGDEDGFVYLVENKGTAASPRWDAPEKLHVNGEVFRITSEELDNMQGPDEVIHGYTCPTLFDWTGSGTLDLILGNITGYYYLLKNIGTPTQPEFAAPEPFCIKGKPFRAEWRVRPTVADLDGDGIPELIFIDRQGMIARYPQKSDTEIGEGIRLVDNLGRWIRLDTVSGGQGRVKLWACDWTGNGTTDILVGTGRSTQLPMHGGSSNMDGRATFLILENIGTTQNPVFLLKPLPLKNGEMVNLGSHSCSPTAVDLNGNGTLEIISGNETGRLFYFPRESFR